MSNYQPQKIARYPAPIRLGIFIVLLLIIWLPLAIPIYTFLSDRNLASILTYILLFGEFLILWRIWAQKVYRQVNPLRRCGLINNIRNRQEFFWGLTIGFCLCVGLFLLETIFGWVQINQPDFSLSKIVLEGFFSATGIGFVEELIFRGWLLEELRQDYNQATAIWTSAVLFALVHFIKPLAEMISSLVTFPALLLLGITLALAKIKFGQRLGICIGLHAGLVWAYYIISVGELIEYTAIVPTWITGINGNPIAGLMGLIFFSILAIVIAYQPQQQ